MGIGHKQQNLFKPNWKHQISHGGTLRNKRLGRGARPLSTKEPLHVVFKINRARLKSQSLRSPQSFSMIHKIIKKYANHFGVKIEQLSVQGDHLHILVRAPRRSRFHDFFRVLAGQIAQRFQKEGLLRWTPSKIVTGTPTGHQAAWSGGTSLWKYRPFSRVIRGYRAYRIVRDYIQLNEKEALQEIRYQKNRLRGLSAKEWEGLWA